MKKCQGCKKTLSKKLFDNSNRSRDGLASKCQGCAEKARQSYHRNLSPVVIKRDHCEKCAEEGVYKMASFGLAKDGVRKACATHKTEDMINLHMKKMFCEQCEKMGLNKIGAYGFEGDNGKKVCAKHKTKGMVNLTKKNSRCKDCELEGIIKNASFGFASDGIKQVCAIHKTVGMIDLAHKRNLCLTCGKDGITKRASYGFPSDGKLQACTKHKTEGMVDILNRKKGCLNCIEEGVFKIATYGLKGKAATACAVHKDDGMIDLVDKKKQCLVCKKTGVFKRAVFGFESDGVIRACKEHKKPKMVDLANKNLNCPECKKIGANKRATFGLESDRILKACLNHKTDDMVNLMDRKRCCIVCAEEGIHKLANYGRLFEKKIHCKTHALKNEYSKNNPKCEKCFERPYYGDEKLDNIPARCEKHKNGTDINMVERACKNCGDKYFIPSTQVMCHGCLGWIKKKEINRGVKESKVAFCLEKLSKITGIPEPERDTRVKKGCSKRRPDFYYPDFTDMFSLIVEVDEHQHSRYSCGILGEMQRMITLFEEDSGGFPLIFVRFNPDPYYYNDKTQKAYRGREDKLIEVIKGLKNKDTINFNIGVIYLYYDGFDNVKIEPLDYDVEDGELTIYHKHPHSLETTHKVKL